MASAAVFEPAKHVAFSPPPKSFTLDELDLPAEGATSPIAITEPFRLFSDEAVERIRADLFRREVLEKHLYTERKDPGVYKLRGYGKDAPFVYSAWKNDAVLKACSKAAGCDLEVIFDYEIGHTNVQLPLGTADNEIMDVLPPPKPLRLEGSGLQNLISQDGDISTMTAWHNDSYPWVCVCMLSDPSGMQGGETALKKGDGSVVKVKAPSTGSAYMLQGGLVNHVALKAHGPGERITMVTSFRPKNPYVHDMSNLGNVKKVSDHKQLFTQWSLYRMDAVAERAKAYAEELTMGDMTAEQVQGAMAVWTGQLKEYIDAGMKELTDEGSKGNYNY